MRIVPMSTWHRWLAMATSLAALAMFPLQCFAQEGDLPGRVGRVADFAGQLFLAPQERPADWEAIGINFPITSGSNLWVSGDGRAEVDFGGGQFSLAGDTNVHVSLLDDRELALFIAQGQLVVRVRVQEPGDATRIDTPNTQVTLARPGLYRIDVAPDRQATTLTVREGEAVLALANGAQQALPGQVVSVVGANPAAADVRYAQGADGFDVWSAERDRRYGRSRSASYVSRQMVGHADLDEYGSWQTYSEYGAVWFPTTVAAGWAPYSDGYWTDVGRWGPTWVDQAPWGYAPFHYGRWAFISGRWGWCPGAYVARPVWAPALVAWYGGSNWGFSVRHGAPVYGWVPLGWREAYHPAWRQCSFNCWAHYNRPYAVNVTVRPSAPPPRYANLAVPGALSAVAGTALTGRRPVPPNLLHVPVPLAASAPVLATAPPFAQVERPVPRIGPGRDIPPPAASTHVRAQTPEPSDPRPAGSPGVPMNPGPSSPPRMMGTLPPPRQVHSEPARTVPPTSQRSQGATAPAFAPRGAATPAEVPSSSGTPLSRVQPPTRLAPPASPSLSGPKGVATPSAAPPAVIAPAPNTQGQAAPVGASSVRAGRAGGEKPAPDPPSTGTNLVR